MWLWILLLASIIFFMYWWGVGGSSSPSPGCNTCAKRKNVQAVE